MKIKQSNLGKYLVFYVVAYALGFSYIAQKDLVIHHSSQAAGWAIVVATTFVLVYPAVEWIRKKRNSR